MAGKNNKNVFLSIIIVAIAAVVGGGYYFNQGSDSSDASENTVEQAQTQQEETQPTETSAPDVESAAGDAVKKAVSTDTEFLVEPGNPVVAKVDGKNITRVDVYRFIQTMPQNLQQLPASTVYPMAMEQVINARIVQNKADAAEVTGSDEFKREMEMAKQQIARNVFLQQQVDTKTNKSKIKSAYKDYLNKIPDVEERRARHILLETEGKATAVLGKLKTGEKFEDLANSLSIGPTASKGGDLGYFAKNEMVPEFSEAAFGMDKNSVIAAPVKTQFGWHVIKLLDIRQRPKPTLEQLTPMIEAELRREALAALLTKWRKGVKIEQFDINGQPLKEGANATGLVMPANPAAK